MLFITKSVSPACAVHSSRSSISPWAMDGRTPFRRSTTMGRLRCGRFPRYFLPKMARKMDARWHAIWMPFPICHFCVHKIWTQRVCCAGIRGLNEGSYWIQVRLQTNESFLCRSVNWIATSFFTVYVIIIVWVIAAYIYTIGLFNCNLVKIGYFKFEMSYQADIFLSRGQLERYKQIR
jgi:hypothetical protein